MIRLNRKDYRCHSAFRLFGVLVAVWAVLVNASSARADAVALLTPDVCGDPAATFDYQWGRAIMRANKAYIIVPAGAGFAIHPINTTDAFNTRTNTDLLVIAHGAPGQVGVIPSNALAQAIQHDHNVAFKSVRFAVCSSANAGGGNPSAASAMATVYGNQVDKIIASSGACALVGSGSILLDKADYRTSVKHTDQALNDAVINNILLDWGQGLAAQCQGIVNAGNFGQLADFMQTVYARYSNADMSPGGNPRTSMNYLLLIKNNTDGKPQIECGKSSGTVCP